MEAVGILLLLLLVKSHLLLLNSLEMHVGAGEGQPGELHHFVEDEDA